MNRLDSIATSVLQKGLSRKTLPILIVSLPLAEACVAFALIYDHDSADIDGSDFSQLAKRLIHAEDQPGGPYKNKDDLVDVDTNIGVAFLFKTMSKEVPALTAFLTAHAVDPAADITLSTYTKRKILAIIPKQPQRTPPSDIKERIVNDTVGILHTFNTSVETQGRLLLQRILDADKADEITLLTDSYRQSIPPRTPIDDIIRLGAANVFCWMAYTAYDDIQDDSHNTNLVSLANILQRQSLFLYQTVADTTKQTLVRQAFDVMDSANVWELAHCRINPTIPFSVPAYTNRNLSDRSMGHILGPILACSTSPVHLLNGLTQYLMAKQLSDDIHDWKSDAAKGHLSFVVCHLLKKVTPSVSHFTLSPTTIHAMDVLFWKSEATRLCKLVLHYTQKARQHYLNAEIPSDAPFTRHISIIEKNIQSAITQRHHYQQFLDSYRRSA